MDLNEILIMAFTFVVAVSTAVYAYLTWRLVSETRRMREVQNGPKSKHPSRSRPYRSSWV